MENVRYADILNDVDDAWSIKEKAKFIYIQICKLSSYDERFIYSKNPQLIESIYNKKVNVDEYISPKLICKTMNSIYSELLNRVGIRNVIIEKKSFVNKYIDANDIALVFYDENDTPYFTAIAADIQRCKYGMKTQFFGGCDENYEEGKREKVCILKEDEHRSIDSKIGYIDKNGIYSDLVFEMISKDVKQLNEFKKFLLDSGMHVVRDYLKEEGKNDSDSLSDEEIITFIKALSPKDVIKIKMKLANFVPHKDASSGPIENKKYSIHLLKNSILNRSEQKTYDSFDMVREEGDEIRVLSILRFNLKPEPIYYLYSDESQQYELLSIEDALKISAEYKAKNNLDLVDGR